MYIHEVVYAVQSIRNQACIPQHREQLENNIKRAYLMAYLTSDITLLIAPVLDALPMGILDKRNSSHHHIQKKVYSED